MADIVTYNAQTGASESVVATDQYYRDNRPNQVIITVANTNKTVGQSEPISVQLVTHPLADGTTQENVSAVDTITLQFGETTQDVVLNSSGFWSDTLNCDYAGTFTIKALSHVSNEISMVVS